MRQVIIQILGHWQLYASAVLTVIMSLILLAIVTAGKLSKFWVVMLLWFAAMGLALWFVVEFGPYFT